MSIKHHIITDKTFEIIKSAVNKMVDIIRPTFGPASNKIIIDKMPYRMVVDDGVQIARDFELNDPKENAIVKIIREVLIKTNDRAGDGTTGAAIILQAIINEVARKTKFDGRKIEIELKRGLEELKTALKKGAKQIKTKDELKKVALVSFDNEKIASMISDLYFKLGKDALITIDKSPTLETTIETTNGVQIARGYISPYMINNPDRLETILDKVYILITDYRLTESTDIMPIMEKMAAKKIFNLVIIAENVEQNALATLVINEPQVINPQTRKLGTFPSVAINLPDVEDRNVLLEDLALLTGAKVFSVEKGDKLENAEIADLGRAQRFICRREESIIECPGGKKGDIAMAITSLHSVIEKEKDEQKKKSLQYRLGMFTNSIAVIKVGAPTENEQKSLKYKIEDCINSVRSAYKHGVVCGAGLALAQIKTSSPILNESLKYPSRQLLENAGIEDNLNLDENHVLNVVTVKSGHFMSVGVMDPIDSLIAGAESAVSIASILLTSSGMIVDAEESDK